MTTTPNQFDCIVVGGGLIGLLSAYLLAKNGKQVVLVEQGNLGRESSWAGGGILSPLYPWRYPDPVNHLVNQSRIHWHAMIQQLEQESGLNAESLDSGLLILDQEEQQQALEWAKRFTTQIELVSPEQIQQIEPALANQSDNGLWMPEVGQVRNPRLLQTLHQAALNTGLTILEQHPMQQLLTEQGNVIGVDCGQKRLLAPQVVIATGAWSSNLLAPLGINLEVAPVRGQMIQFQAPAGLLKRITLYQGRYIIPRQDGRVLAGSTLEYVGFDKSTSEQAKQELFEAAIKLAPALEEYPVVHHWSGLRPGSTNGIPTVGETSQIKGLYLNCGHFRNGVAISLGSCQLLCDLVCGTATAIDPSPYAPIP